VLTLSGGAENGLMNAFFQGSNFSDQKNRFCRATLRLVERRFNQGCQMVYFQTKNPNLEKFWSAMKDIYGHAV
jgi:Leu/Phe-tRNA-protein transferase